jgi:hypothetical protein
MVYPHSSRRGLEATYRTHPIVRVPGQSKRFCTAQCRKQPLMSLDEGAHKARDRVRRRHDTDSTTTPPLVQNFVSLAKDALIFTKSTVRLRLCFFFKNKKDVDRFQSGCAALSWIIVLHDASPEPCSSCASRPAQVKTEKRRREVRIFMKSSTNLIGYQSPSPLLPAEAPTLTHLHRTRCTGVHSVVTKRLIPSKSAEETFRY